MFFNRFFSAIYGAPTSSNIFGCVCVRVHRIAAGFTRKVFALPVSHLSTSRTNLRGMKIYDGERLASIAFIVAIGEKDFPFKLPARIDRVEKVLYEMYRRPRAGTAQKIKDQAERTAWKILADWVDIQMSLVELDQAELLEVFMPYLYNHQTETTLFDRFKKNGFAMLEDRSKK
jgi:hypothetical protein